VNNIIYGGCKTMKSIPVIDVECQLCGDIRKLPEDWKYLHWMYTKCNCCCKSLKFMPIHFNPKYTKKEEREIEEHSFACYYKQILIIRGLEYVNKPYKK